MPQGILILFRGSEKTKRFARCILLTAALLAACGPAATPIPTAVPPTASPLPPTATPVPPTATPEPRTLTVFAAASLTDAFTEIGHNFEASHPGVTVALNFAGSQTLSTQITQGASVDVFAPANHTEMDKVVAANLIQKDTPKDFLTNKLLVILPASNPANVQTLQDLSKSDLKLVLGDTTVPVGKYARQILDNISKDAAYGADFKTKVLDNVVSNETDVKQVVAKVQLGEADAGIVYISDAVAAPELKTIEIPANFNVIAKYPIAALTNGPQSELASGFIAYVLSADGQVILKKWGFTPVAP
jgi:molybdate transport system substrate-binding protein